jgi:hypothetical protein
VRERRLLAAGGAHGLKNIHPLLIMMTAVLAVPAVSAARADQSRTLTASVGPGTTFSLTRNGAKFDRLPAGSYTIVVRDRSRTLNFHLQRFAAPGAPHLDRRTGVAFVGKATWKVTLSRGTYNYRSDRRSGRLNGSFKVS